MRASVIAVALGMMTLTPALSAAAWREARADARGPASVRDSALVPVGAWSLAYRLELAWFGGLRDGSSGLSDEAVRAQGFEDRPQSKRALSHRVSVHYGVHERVSLGLHLPLHSLVAEYAFGDVRGEVEAFGLGDIALGALVDVMAQRAHRLHVSLMLGLPSGAIHVRDATPRSERERLGYLMRLGSGSFAVVPAVTYRGQRETMGWGAQLLARQPLDRNVDGYQVGGRYRLQAWWSYLPWAWIAGTVRTGLVRRSTVSGADDDLVPTRDPSHDPERQALWAWELAAALDVTAPWASWDGARLGVEAALPLWQHVDGPQLERDVELVVYVGWRL